MTEKFRVLDGEVDLEREDVRDSQNRRIDADYIERAVVDVHARRGRRPLADDTPAGEHSPQVSFRMPDQTRRRAEERDHRSSSVARPEWLARPSVATAAANRKIDQRLPPHPAALLLSSDPCTRCSSAQQAERPVSAGVQTSGAPPVVPARTGRAPARRCG